jgi:hypothetical protein
MDKSDSEASDKLYKGTKIGLASIAAFLAAASSGPATPLAAGGAALVMELFSATFGPPLEKRRDQWIESLYEKLKELETKIDGFTIDNLAENEVFITTLINATQIAIRSHQKEKHDSLRNTVLNAALPNSLDEELQLLFLSFLDNFSATHVRLLNFLDKPQAVVGLIDRINPGNNDYVTNCINKAFPGFSEESVFYDQIVKDLREKGLLSKKENVQILLEKSMKEQRIKYAVGQGNVNEAFSYILDDEKQGNESIKQIVDELLYSPNKQGKLLSDLGRAFVQFLSSPM